MTVNGPLAPTTWLFVTMSPFESKTTPEPSPCGLWIWTTDGDSLCTTAVTACWKASAAAAGLRREWLVFGAVFGEEPPPSDTAATMPPATAAPATGASHQMCRRSMRSLYRRRRADSRIPSYDQAAMIYCVIPRELADELYDKMVEYYQDNPNVTVIIERREGRDRRNEGEQRLEDKMARQRETDALAMLKQGNEIGAVAKKYSDDTASSGSGGGLTLKTTDIANVPQLKPAIDALQPGQSSPDFVRVDDGYYFFKMTSRDATTTKMQYVIIYDPKPELYTAAKRAKWFVDAITGWEQQAHVKYNVGSRAA